jgi:amidase/aspartyl-tRNA(Asn)/glutamyl-tRNA(Gln) amidotransferase subunit A
LTPVVGDVGMPDHHGRTARIMVATELCGLTATDLLQAYASRRISPVDVMQAVLARVQIANPAINALFHLVPEAALEQARASERRWAAGTPSGLLDGIPVSVKDSVAVAGMPYWRGCRGNMRRPFSTQDAPPAARLKDAGAIIFGKTTMPDFGMFGAGVSTAHGISRNPWNLAFNTGGSTSGGAAAVAAGLGPLTVGTDIGGSVRLPASLCGLSSIKPTQGRIPHLPPSTMRSAGPLARTVTDAALLLTVLAGADPRDYGAVMPEAIAYHEKLSGNVVGLKLGLVRESGFVAAEPAVAAAIAAAAACLAAAGAEIVLMPPLTEFDYGAAFNRIFAVRSRIELDSMAPQTRDGVHPDVLQICAAADGISGVELGQAYDVLEQLKARLTAMSATVDFLLAPTTPVVNFPAEAIAPDPDRMIDYVGFTAPFNQTGQPAAVTCCGFDTRGLPIGLQIIGRRYDDIGVLNVAFAYEQRRGFEISWPQPAVST